MKRSGRKLLPPPALFLASLNCSLFANKVRDDRRHGRVEADHVQHAPVVWVLIGNGSPDRTRTDEYEFTKLALLLLRHRAERKSKKAEVLNRPANRLLAAQSARVPARPVRLTQDFPRQQHQVRATVADDLVRVGGLGDAADGRRGDARFPPDAFGKGRLPNNHAPRATPATHSLPSDFARWFGFVV